MVIIAVVPRAIINNITRDGKNMRVLCNERKYKKMVASKRKKIAVKAQLDRTRIIRDQKLPL